jgi:hypothetical protein
MTRMTVSRTSRMAWKASRCGSGASWCGDTLARIGRLYMACADRRKAHRRGSAGFPSSHQPGRPWRTPRLAEQLACHRPTARPRWRSVRSGSACATPQASCPAGRICALSALSSCSRCSANVLLNCSRCSSSVFSASLLVARRPKYCAARVPITVRISAVTAAITSESAGRTQCSSLREQDCLPLTPSLRSRGAQLREVMPLHDNLACPDLRTCLTGPARAERPSRRTRHGSRASRALGAALIQYS